MIACGGVLVPDGDDYRRTCFVEERGLREELRHVVYANGSRPLQVSSDNLWPDHLVAPGIDNEQWKHDVHLYCQHVQGGMFSGRMNVESGHLAGIAQAAGRATTQRYGGWVGVTDEIRRQNGSVVGVTGKGNHVKHHVARDIVSPYCGLCVDEPIERPAKQSMSLQAARRKGAHVAQHVNRGIVNPECEFCM